MVRALKTRRATIRPKRRQSVPPKLQARLESASRKLAAWLPPKSVGVPKCKLIVDPNLPWGALAMRKWPDEVHIKDAEVPESVLLHELVHAVQNTQETTIVFKHLYRVLAEGLADWIAKRIYPKHLVKYPKAVSVVAPLMKADPSAVVDLLKINDLVIELGDLGSILKDPRLPPYPKGVLRKTEKDARSTLKMVHDLMAKGEDWDVTLISLGEEWAAWKFYLDPRFDPVRKKSDAFLQALYRGWEKAMSEPKVVNVPSK